MQNNFIFRGGAVLGRDHAMRGQNRQDGYALKEVEIGGQIFKIGVVSDGCSGGKCNEVSGLLLPIFVVNQTIRLLEYEVPIRELPTALYPQVIGFLESLRNSVPFSCREDSITFVRDFLLATVIGFVVGESEGVAFSSGDGFVVVNDEIVSLDYGNRSPYIGYHLVPQAVLHGDRPELPRTFDARPLEVENLVYLAAATDGFRTDLLRRLRTESLPGPLGVQLWLNRTNGPRSPYPPPERFWDDGAVVELRRCEKGGEAE